MSAKKLESTEYQFEKKQQTEFEYIPYFWLPY